MNYIKFKEELYRTIAGADTEGKTIRILEKNASEEMVRFAQFGRVWQYWDSESGIFEDMLYVTGNGCGGRQPLYWNLRILYEKFEREGWQGILPEILFRLQEQERIMLRPLNYSRHREEVENGIYQCFGDIALVLQRLLHDDGDEMVTEKYSRAMAEKWHLPDELLLTNALLSSCTLMPPILYGGRNTSGGIKGYHLTTAKGSCGAISLFYPGVIERLACRFGGDYHVGFPSVREALVYPARDGGLGELKEAILWAKAVFDEREFLTEQVYRYSSDYARLIEV